MTMQDIPSSKSFDCNPVTESMINVASGSGPGGEGSEADFITIGSFCLDNETPSAVMTQMKGSFDTDSDSALACRSAFVRLINLTSGNIVKQKQITAPPQGHAHYDDLDLFLEPTPITKGRQTYEIQISRFAVNVSMIVTQQWWNR